jgi:hypothetical protein
MKITKIFLVNFSNNSAKLVFKNLENVDFDLTLTYVNGMCNKVSVEIMVKMHLTLALGRQNLALITKKVI